MRPVERVIAQLEHRETDFVPYVLPIEEEVARRLDEYYGDDAWRDLKQDHIASAGGGVAHGGRGEASLTRGAYISPQLRSAIANSLPIQASLVHG
ncbi:MAG: hypothetical protein GTO31_10785, partial [Xanthomonadales bacterium]|nr:hypothetical protein [Xanthomonadales bacterium]